MSSRWHRGDPASISSQRSTIGQISINEKALESPVVHLGNLGYRVDKTPEENHTGGGGMQLDFSCIVLSLKLALPIAKRELPS